MRCNAHPPQAQGIYTAEPVVSADGSHGRSNAGLSQDRDEFPAQVSLTPMRVCEEG
jgi:hypothetical protein